jgi:NAD(P)-dependent dehydrogenase (short-subunit alcohol dehydrogenase family)
MEDKIAVVTGASQGIGEAIARRFAAAGMRLVLSDLTDEVLPKAQEIAKQFPDAGIIAVVTDVSDPKSCDELIAAAIKQHRSIDVLAHATAIGQRRGPTVELDPDEWDRIMAVNAKGAFLLCRSAIPSLLKTKGNIVFTGSYTGEQGQVERAAYSASKGALRLFTQSLALELAPQGIRVNGVAPAYVESALVRLGLEQAAEQAGITVEEARLKRDATIPLGRQATAEEVSEAFFYLASPQASYITGTWLDVNGGLVLR